MDADSLAQVEKIITTAVSGVEGRLREDMQALGTSLRQEFGDKTDALATSLRQEFGEKTGALAVSIQQEFGSEMRALRDEFGEKFDEAKRHRGVLYEDVLHRIDLVVEGHQALHQRIDKLEAGMEQGFIEMRSLMQSSQR